MEGNQKTRIQKFMGGNKKGYQTAFHMAWPAVMESFFIALAGMVDSLMVSSMGPEAVAAVGLTTQPKFIGLCIFIATNVSVSALVARRRGEKDQYGANQVLLMAAAFTLAVGTLISMACVFFADPIIRLCGANEDTQAGAVRYFQIIMGGMMFNIISMAINAAQRGAGNTKIAMRTNVTSNVVNMIGNYLLIQGNLGFPRLGITGAALATVFGTVIACLMSILSVMKRDNFVSIPFIIKEKVRVTLEPAKNHVQGGLQCICGADLHADRLPYGLHHGGKAGDRRLCGPPGGNERHEPFLFLWRRDAGGGGGPLRQEPGRKAAGSGPDVRHHLPEDRQYDLHCAGGPLHHPGYLVFSSVFDEPHLVAMGVEITRVLTFIVLLQIAQVIYMGCLRGAGDVVFTTIASTISITFVRPILSYVFCYACGLGLVGIWLGILGDQTSRLLLTTWRFKSGRWMKIEI